MLGQTWCKSNLNYKTTTYNEVIDIEVCTYECAKTMGMCLHWMPLQRRDSSLCSCR